jgi:hypothetical protein
MPRYAIRTAWPNHGLVARIMEGEDRHPHPYSYEYVEFLSVGSSLPVRRISWSPFSFIITTCPILIARFERRWREAIH